MADRLDEKEDNTIVAADIVNAQLVFKRYDGSTLAYGEAVYDPHINSLDPNTGPVGEVTILITGEYFTEEAVVEANQMEADMTFYMDETMVYGQFMTDAPGEVEITVRQGEQESNSVMFTVT